MARDDATAAAQAVIGSEETVKAAGIFALQDNYKDISAAGLATSVAMPKAANPALNGLAAAGAIEAGREANAAQQGVTERMMVAVTDRTIHILAMPVMGNSPKGELMSFDRQT